MNDSKPSIIIGLGKTGHSCLHYLLQQGKSVIVMDTRLEPPGLAQFRAEFPDIQVYLGELKAEILLTAEELIVSPGLSLQDPAIASAIAAGVAVVGDIELFVRVAKAPIVAVTGTNAKGTVTTLVGDMLSQAGHQVLLGGNIGIPALDLLAEPVPDYYVLELSSFQLETTYSLRAVAATILNFSEDHLDRHGTMAAYITAKQRIYQNCKTAIWNRDDVRTAPEIVVISRISFGISEPQAGEFGLRRVQDKYFLAYGTELLLAVDELFIKGKHNWVNALAALAFGSALKLPMAPMLAALKEFKGLEHRCEWVAEQDQITWYNDSKGTNVGATLAAIEGLGSATAGKLVLIAGGLGKGADFSPLRDSVAKYVRTVILIGRDGPLIEQALQSVVPLQYALDFPTAIALAKKAAQAQDAVLLSPACASWDMFRDYEQRGEMFKTLVRKITV